MRPLFVLTIFVYALSQLSAAPVTYRITGQFPATEWGSPIYGSNPWPSWMKEGKVDYPGGIPWAQKGPNDFLYIDRIREPKGKNFEIIITAEDTPTYESYQYDIDRYYYFLNVGNFMSPDSGFIQNYGYGALLYVNGKLVQTYEGIQIWRLGDNVQISCEKGCSGDNLYFGFSDARPTSRSPMTLTGFEENQIEGNVHQEHYFTETKSDGKPSESTTLFLCMALTKSNPKLKLEVLPEAIELPRLPLTWE